MIIKSLYKVLCSHEIVSAVGSSKKIKHGSDLTLFYLELL